MASRYIDLSGSELLGRRAQRALKSLEKCTLCPHRCGVDRTAGELGYCRTGRLARVDGHGLHFGEEAPLVGEAGSGTIFFAHCNLGCTFCQNWEISRPAPESLPPELDARELADIMLGLQAQGAANINVVSPSHVGPQLLEALALAADGGLKLPLVWNSGGYDGPETLGLLDGVVDIYMPDVKFWDPEVAKRLCGAADYPQRAKGAVAEMHRQVGDLRLDDRGMAVGGLLVRHLVMPEGLAGTPQWMEFLAGLSKDTFVNIMGQYRPCGEAAGDIGREVTTQEVEQATAQARHAGLHRLEEDAAVRMLFKLLGP